jgi:hypothetical protein
MRDFAPHRRFLDQGLVLFDLRNTRPSAVLRMVIKFGRLKYHLACNDRVYKFIRNFVSSPLPSKQVLNLPADRWQLNTKLPPFDMANIPVLQNQPCQFAFQPIVDPARGNISSLEALIRGPDGGSPQDYFSTIPEHKLHEADLASKGWALAMARRLGIGNHKVAINLLPMSLVKIPGAVNILLDHIKRNQLDPEQVIVEVTEDEVICMTNLRLRFVSYVLRELVWRSTILVPDLPVCHYLPSFSRTNRRSTGVSSPISICTGRSRLSSKLLSIAVLRCKLPPWRKASKK